MSKNRKIPVDGESLYHSTDTRLDRCLIDETNVLVDVLLPHRGLNWLPDTTGNEKKKHRSIMIETCRVDVRAARKTNIKR